MLYPDFNDLIALKDRTLDLMHLARSVKSNAPGNHHSLFRGQGLEFDSVREYVPGDDIRSIDWRVTARTGHPHVKLFREDRECRMVICIDMNASMRFGTRNTFKSIQAAHAAAILGWQGIAHQDRVSACLFGDVPGGIQYSPPKHTRKSFCAFLKMLATPPKEQHRIVFEDVLQSIHLNAHPGSMIYFLSDFMNLSKQFHYEAILSKLSKRNNVVFIAINDQADKSLYPFGVMGFCTNHQETVFVNTANANGRKAYTAQWQENRHRLQELTAGLKIPMIELTTESDVYRELALGLKNIARRKKG